MPQGTTVTGFDATLTLAETQLSRLGHRVLLAHSADEALGLFLANEVHLLLVDYVMPGMDGAQLVRAIRGFDDALRRAPALVHEYLTTSRGASIA